MQPKSHFLVAVLLTLGTLPGYSWQTGSRLPTEPQGTGEASIVVPAETEIPIRLGSSISSRAAHVGQHFYGQTFYPVTVRNRIVIPVGTYIEGTITEVRRQGLMRGKTLIRLRCDSMTFPSGATIQLVSALSGVGGNGSEGFDQRGEPAVEGAGQRVKAGDVRTITQATLGGFLMGAILTGSRAGAAFGGFGGGLAAWAGARATRQQEIVLPPGSDLNFRLTRPLVFDRRALEPSLDQPDGAVPPASGPGCV